MKQEEMQGVEIVNKPKTRNQYVAASVCALSCICCGLYTGWASYSLPLLFSKNNSVFPQPITATQGDLIGGIPNLGATVGTLMFGWLYDKFGRKRGGLVLAVPFAASWLLILFGPSAEYIIVARFLAGMSGGGCMSLPPLYIGETADIAIKGTLGSFLALGFVFGVLVSFIVGSIFGYHSTATILLGFVVLYAILMSFMPETPIYLMKNGLEQEAAKSISWLKSVPVNSITVQEELAYIRQLFNNVTEIKDSSEKSNNGTKNEIELPESEQMLSSTDQSYRNIKRPAWKQLALDRPSRNAFLLNTLLFVFQTVVGLYAIQTYAADIFTAANSGISPHLCSIVFAVSSLGGCAASSALADRAGRKILMASSCAGMACLTLIIGFLLQTGYGPSILPIICIWLCTFFFYSGAGSIPFVVIGEYFSTEVKDLAACLLVQSNCLMCFVLIFFTKSGINLLGIHGIFYFFGVMATLSAVGCVILQPETKGLNQEQILGLFGGPKLKARPVAAYKVVPLNDV